MKTCDARLRFPLPGRVIVKAAPTALYLVVLPSLSLGWRPSQINLVSGGKHPAQHTVRYGVIVPRERVRSGLIGIDTAGVRTCTRIVIVVVECCRNFAIGAYRQHRNTHPDRIRSQTRFDPQTNKHPPPPALSD